MSEEKNKIIKTSDFRLFASQYGNGAYFSIHNVYYEDGVPIGFSEEYTIGGYSKKQVDVEIKLLLSSTGKPILDFYKFPEEYVGYKFD